MLVSWAWWQSLDKVVTFLRHFYVLLVIKNTHHMLFKDRRRKRKNNTKKLDRLLNGKTLIGNKRNIQWILSVLFNELEATGWVIDDIDYKDKKDL